MKLLILILMYLVISGCLASFDSYEYREFALMAALADKKDCGEINLNRMMEESRILYHYSAHKRNEQAVIDAAQDIFKSVKEVQDRAKLVGVSSTYCSLKMDGIEFLSGAYAETVGRRMR